MSEISPKQLEANRENAKLGGVKTEAGKAVSKYNAIKHGILRQAITEYERDLYQDFVDDLLEQLAPVGLTETILVERIAVCYLRLFRIAKVENEYMQSKLNPHIVENSFSLLIKGDDRVIQEGYVPKMSLDTLEDLNEKILRYDTNIERSLYRALHELQRIQAARAGEKPPAPIAIDVDVSQE